MDATLKTLSYGLKLPADFAVHDVNVIVVGSKTSVLRVVAEKDGIFSTAMGGLTDAEQELLTAVAQGISPFDDKSSSAETHLPQTHASSVSPRRIFFGILPTACSRHNSPSKSHSVTDCVMKGVGGVSRDRQSHVLVILALDHASHAFAAGCAVARAFPLYMNRKSMPNAAVIDCVFAVSGPGGGEGGGRAKGDEIDIEQIGVLNTAVQDCKVASEGIMVAAQLVDAPTNVLDCTTFTAHAALIAAKLPNVSFKVIKGEELRTQGLGGLYGVGKAAVEPPALVILSYLPPGCNSETDASLVWVGKGIVYDTGGLSIKTKTGMPGMKRDMGGAAAILSAFQAVVKRGSCVKPLHALLCLAENSVASNATRPDDIHTMYSKKTVEINNTDAEGRLVLADGVAYAACHLNPSVIIDMATLTGAQGVATGLRHAALYCNDDELERTAVECGRYSGDLCHGMPYAPEFFRGEFSSAVADMKNSVSNRSNAQVSCAGQFIGNHIDEYLQKGSWLHIDMASPVHRGERATGYGVALLFSICTRLAGSQG